MQNFTVLSSALLILELSRAVAALQMRPDVAREKVTLEASSVIPLSVH